MPVWLSFFYALFSNISITSILGNLMAQSFLIKGTDLCVRGAFLSLQELEQLLNFGQPDLENVSESSASLKKSSHVPFRADLFLGRRPLSYHATPWQKLFLSRLRDYVPYLFSYTVMSLFLCSNIVLPERFLCQCTMLVFRR